MKLIFFNPKLHLRKVSAKNLVICAGFLPTLALK